MGLVSGGTDVCASEESEECVCVCRYVWVVVLGEGGGLGWSHLGADGSGVGIEIGWPATLGIPQQGASDGGQRHRQRLVLIVRGHVGDALPAIAHLIGGTDVKGGVIGGAGRAVAAPPPCRF